MIFVDKANGFCMIFYVISNSVIFLLRNKGKSPENHGHFSPWESPLIYKCVSVALFLLCLNLSGCKDESSSETQLTSITWVAPPTRSDIAAITTIDWTPPTTRVDGTSLPMNEIAGYKIYMTDSANSLIAVIEVNSAYIMEYQLSSQVSGTYYFSVTALDNNLVESDPTDTVSKTFE